MSDVQDPSQGKYIVFVGVDGSGKSSVAQQLKIEFPGIVVTREPGGTTFAEELRQILLHAPDADDPWIQYDLFMAAGKHLSRTDIVPALKNGRLVISDRGRESTWAYQCYSQMGMRDAAWFFREMAIRDLCIPDVYVYFNIDPTVAMQRRVAAGGMTRFEAKGINFQHSVRTGLELFLGVAESKTRVIRVDASQDQATVFQEVTQHLRPYLPR